MNNELGHFMGHFDFLRGEGVAEIVGTILSVLAFVIAIYTHWKVRHITRRNHKIGQKFSAGIGPWLMEAQRSYIERRFGPAEKEH
jgi:hypothetical protein